MRFITGSIRAIGLVLVFTLLTAACGGSFDDEATSVAASEGGSGDDGAFDLSTSDSTGEADTTDEEEPATDRDDALAVPTALTAADIGRDIIFTATIVVEADDVAQTGSEATQIITSLGGIVFGQSTTLDPEPRSVLTFKVLPERFDDALEALAGVGHLVDQTISADDVTDRVVDLESRITTAEASVERLRNLLVGATDLEDVAKLERELVDRETQLEQLRGQLRTVEDQVSLATITLTITQRGRETLPVGLLLNTWLGETRAEACPGSFELAVDRGADVVWCVEIENTGDVALLDIELDSDVLRLRTADFDIDTDELARLEPGERLVATIDLALEDGRVRRTDARGGLFLDIQAEATPADDDGSTVRTGGQTLLVADGDEPLPGFGDAFGESVGAIRVGGSVLLILLGALAPFIPLAVGLVWWLRRRSKRGAAG